MPVVSGGNLRIRQSEHEISQNDETHFSVAHCPFAPCRKSHFKVKLSKSEQEYCSNIVSLCLAVDQLGGFVRRTCLRGVDSAPLVRSAQNRGLVWFSSLRVMSFLVVYEFPSVLLGRTNGKLYAASHAELGFRGAAAPVILYY